jgi:alcohol/geraniol dehydrogenase (NADP+)
MIPSLILGYASMTAGEPLKPFYYSPPEMGVNDVRVAVTHCGLCHTDIQAVDDYYEITNYPFVPGHEIVGYVSQAGNGVSGLNVGDRVGIGWQGRSCMKCEWCLKGEEQMCMDIVDSGTWVPYGGFSSSVIADYRFAYPLPEAMPSETAAVLMCAGISVFSPLQRYALQPSLKVAIMGVGGLGHLAIQFSHALNHEVTVISSSTDKLEQAKSFGADFFILSTDQAELRQHYFYFDLLLVTATGELPWYYLLNIVKKEGRIVLVSFPEVNMHPRDLVAHNLSITGSFIGNHNTMREMLTFAQAHHISPMVELMPMVQVNDAIRRVRENKARYRIVLVNEPADG